MRSNPGTALSAKVGMLTKNDGTGIWSEMSSGGLLPIRNVAILLFDIEVNTSLIVAAKVDLSKISLQSQLIGRPKYTSETKIVKIYHHLLSSRAFSFIDRIISDSFHT